MITSRNALLFIFFAVGLKYSSNAQLSRKELKKVYKTAIDTATQFIYELPFKKGKKIFIAQGYLGRFSHQNRFALDFKLKKGDTVYAARSGVVIRVKKDGIKGGMNKKYRSQGNNIVIEHQDKTRAGYWHFQFNGVLVNVGDTIQQGQPIGLCGKTGYATAPHLHFIVWKNSRDFWQQIATPFYTYKRIQYLKPWHRYKK